MSTPGPLAGVVAGRTARQRARVLGAGLALTGLVTWMVDLGVDALSADEQTLMVEREGGGALKISAAGDACWRVEATEVRAKGTNPDDAAEPQVLVRRGCGTQEVALPDEAVFGAVEMIVETGSTMQVEDAVAMVWAGRQMIRGTLLADADGTRSRTYTLSLDEPGVVLVATADGLTRATGNFAASPATEVRGRARKVAKAVDLDPDWRTDAIAEFGSTVVGRQVGDTTVLARDLSRARQLSRSALQYRIFLEALTRSDAEAVHGWMDQAAEGKHGEALGGRVIEWRSAVAQRLLTSLVSSAATDERRARAAGAVGAGELPSSSVWEGRLKQLDAVLAISSDVATPLAQARYRWEQFRLAAVRAEAAQAAEPSGAATLSGP